MDFFKYGHSELAHLKNQDQRLAEAIDHIGMIERAVIPDLFAALINSVVAQQISNKAAATVWNRMVERFGPITAQSIATLPVEKIQQCGMSLRKAGYIKGIAEAILLRAIDLSELPHLADEEVVKRLDALPGIGAWTAEMILIFSMQRPDVVSWGDLGIRRGMQTLYGLAALQKPQFDQYRENYAPYGSVASLYLWEIARERFFTGAVTT